MEIHRESKFIFELGIRIGFWDWIFVRRSCRYLFPFFFFFGESNYERLTSFLVPKFCFGICHFFLISSKIRIVFVDWKIIFRYLWIEESVIERWSDIKIVILNSLYDVFKFFKCVRIVFQVTWTKSQLCNNFNKTTFDLSSIFMIFMTFFFFQILTDLKPKFFDNLLLYSKLNTIEGFISKPISKDIQ